MTHPIADVHADHRGVAATVLEALPQAVIDTGFPRRVYTCDSYNSLTLHGSLHATTIVDVTAVFDVKMRALAAHASQPINEHFAPMANNLGRLWGARIGVTHAEAFTVIPVLGRLSGAACL